MLKKRVVIWFVISGIGFSILFGRLIQIQLLYTENFTKREINLLEASVKQRSQEVILDSGRGNFIDRNGDPFIYEQIPVLILFPFLNKIDWDASEVAKIIGENKENLLQSVREAKEPFAYGGSEPIRLKASQMKKINSLKIPGVFAVEKKYFLDSRPAEQLIGVVKENKAELEKRYPEKEFSQQTLLGISGMEKSFDEFLIAEGKSKLVYHVDGDGAPLFGINVKYADTANPFYPVNIKTSLDKRFQGLAEKLVEQHGINKGGLVLLDIETNSVLAMVSRPHINKKDPYAGNGIENMMLNQQIMGSVFKTVVAAAAIDHNLDNPTRSFNCSRKINGEPDLKYQHGMLDFTNSFARSCNNTFATIANELKDIDPNLLEQYAEKLGLLGPVGWQGSVFHLENFRQLPEEDAGRIFLSEDAKKDANFVSMTGIGQHEVRATPLAVANMMSTVAKGGKNEQVRVASKIEYQNGTSMFNFPKRKGEGEQIAPYTAMKLQSLLREVVTNEKGTGRLFKDLPYAVAGKSGTAQTGKQSNNQFLENRWFAGYFPFDKPKYALVTVKLDAFETEGGVNPLFADMVKEIYKIDHSEEKER